MRLIGSGSYGEVWLARNALGTPRAVKVVFRSAFDSDQPYERELAGVQRFEPISRSHEGLVDILHVGRNDEAGFFYYVMELADDANVAALVRARADSSPAPAPVQLQSPAHAVTDVATYAPRTLASERGARGRMPAADCFPVFLTLTSALAHLHKHGLLHRDIKPANIIFVGGVAKLADIGLVAAAGDAHTFVGTEGFIPPEGPGTKQADLYSLAKTFYEVATGRDRLEFPSLPLERGHVEENRALVELNAVLLKACAPHPNERYASADEIHGDLALLQSGRSVKHLHQVERRLRLARKIGIAALALALVATAGVLVAMWRAEVESRLRAEAQAARNDAEAKLFESLLITARAERGSRQAGARWRSLEALERATSLVSRSSNFTSALPELRSEVISALALPDFRELRRWRPLSPAVTAPYAISFDGSMERMARALSNGTVSISRVADDAELQRITPPDETVRHVGPFSSQGTFLYTRSQRRDEWLVLRVVDGHVIERIHDPDGSSPGIFSPDERWLVYGRKDGTVEARDLHGGPAQRWSIANWAVTSLAFSADGMGLAVAGATNQFHLIEVPAGRRTRTFDSPGDRPLALAWNGTQTVVAASRYGPLYLFDAASTNASFTMLTGHQAETISCAVHPSGEFALSSSWDNTTRLWELPTAKLAATHRDWGDVAGFNQRGTRFVLQHGTTDVAMYEFADRAVCRHLVEPSPPGVFKAPLSISFSPDGELLLVPEHNIVRLLTTADGKEQARVPGSLNAGFEGFEGDGGAFLVANMTGVVRWPLRRDEARTLAIGPPQLLTNSPANWISSTSNGLVAATRFRDTPILFDKGRPLPTLESTTPGTFMALSADGRWAAALSYAERGIRIWNLTTRKLAHTLAGRRPYGYAFRRDGERFAANDLEALRVWEVESGRLVLEAKWPVPNSGQARLAWSPDGRVIATTLNQYQIGLFDAVTGELLTRLEDPDPQLIEWLEFNPNGSQLAVACSSHVVQLWDLRRIRAELAARGLDWNHPPLPMPTMANTTPFRVTVVGR
ncbi:MAG: serine/threonine-protein kinase [Verrucomicrobiales bacterium]|nr:serine/threonine-protein kinase [Verrucomicrobiales bacterium]